MNIYILHIFHKQALFFLIYKLKSKSYEKDKQESMF